MSKYFTRKGDDGSTGLLGEGRYPKNDSRFEAIGAIDEANSALGLARAACEFIEIQEIITTIQRDLYRLMAELSATPENQPRFKVIDQERIVWLEKQTIFLGESFEMPKEFILPGDTIAAGFLDLSRTIIRRAERRVTALFHQGVLDNPDILSYLNRLSSLCFVMEVWTTLKDGNSDLTLAKTSDE
jgi:cob(I)alamin adenosyltransferase